MMRVSVSCGKKNKAGNFQVRGNGGVGIEGVEPGSTHPQEQQLLLEVGGCKGDCRRTGNVGRLQFGDQIVHCQRVNLLVLREGRHGAPAKATDERYARRIVRGVRRNGAIEIRKFSSITQCRRCGAKGDL